VDEAGTACSVIACPERSRGIHFACPLSSNKVTEHDPAFKNVKNFTNFSCEPHGNLIIIRRDADSKLKRVFFN
jgi:hypothetical protein